MRLRQKHLCRSVFLVMFFFFISFGWYFEWIQSSVLITNTSDKQIDGVSFQEVQIDEIVNYNNASKSGFNKIINAQTSQALFIFSSMRSGSSFVGQIFNQHPSAFYFFEPLFPLHDSCKIDLAKKVEILSGLVSCDLTASVRSIQGSLEDSLNKDTNDDNHLQRRIANLRKCKASTMCFRESTKGLCKKETCEHNGVCLRCSSSESKQYIEEKCQESKLRVIKTVRSCHLDLLGRVQQQSQSLFKVLHLVRDPRATAISRLKMHHGLGNVVKEMKMNCLFDLANLDAYRNRQPTSWLNGRYMFVRYEDVVNNTRRFLKTANNFLNHNLAPQQQVVDLTHKDVLTWLRENTLSSVGSIYSTSRNISEQASKWRKDASMKIVSDIQRVCQKMMASFGYVTVTTSGELNNYSTDLFKPLSNDKEFMY